MRLTKKRKLAILRGMRSKLERRGGWIKGAYKLGKGNGSYGYCLAGAAWAAGYDEGIRYPWHVLPTTVVERLSIEALAKAKLAERGELYRGSATIGFNDSKKTKKADVLALIDEKIAELTA